MKKKIKIFSILLVVIILISTILIITLNKKETELRTIKSQKELLKIYEGETNQNLKENLIGIITMPFSILYYPSKYYYYDDIAKSDGILDAGVDTIISNNTSNSESSSSSSSTKSYSTTNIQVENVDEADIVKTDGDYIYSISEENVVITDVKDPKKPTIVSKFAIADNSIPEDLILYKDKLIVISEGETTGNSYYRNANTTVEIYDISSIENPVLTKNYTMNKPYYTSRCIDNVLYVISTGSLKKADNDEIDISYTEDGMEKSLNLENIKYLKDLKTRKQTLISVVDLNNERSDIKIDSYLMDISNAYVSENAIYLLNEKYKYESYIPSIKSIFGLKGVFGLADYETDGENGYWTEIYKFDIYKNGNVKYSAKTKIEGKTINQYSLDEKDNHLRIALYNNKGSRVAILDEKLKQIGISNYVAKGETMYSSRFIGNKVYFVTYKTMDPLFVMDLSDETNPKVLGELKIPGYSTYLHPYDENHIIGIGMETKETVRRDYSGKVISTTAKIVGMKMALFDISNVNTPIQISSVVIGDSRTTSAILTNPKALLFSKEKSLIAIPVNNYSDDFEINDSDSYSSLVNNYSKYNKPYIAEGYFVYNINIQDGFKLKGIITHEKEKNTYYNNTTKLLRGLYIDNNLYTVSETAIKVNDLDSLKQVGEIKIKEVPTNTTEQSDRKDENDTIVLDEKDEHKIENNTIVIE